MKQSTTNDQVKNLIQIRKSLAHGKSSDLSKNQAFLDFLAIQAEITAQIDQTWATVRNVMEQHNVNKMDGNWGSITFESAEYLSAVKNAKLDKAITKTVLDTDKAKDYRNLFGELPPGVVSRKINKFVKRIKVA